MAGFSKIDKHGGSNKAGRTDFFQKEYSRLFNKRAVANNVYVGRKNFQNKISV